MVTSVAIDFNIAKSKHLHFETEPAYGYFTSINSVTSHKDLSIVFDNYLKFHDHTTIEVTAKAMCIYFLV